MQYTELDKNGSPPKKLCFFIGHCPNYAPPPLPQLGQPGPLFWMSKTKLCEYDGIMPSETDVALKALMGWDWVVNQDN